MACLTVASGMPGTSNVASNVFVFKTTMSAMQLDSIENLVDIPSKKWESEYPPRKVLAIRLQATGDMVITLPYLQNLRQTLPADCRLDLLTRKEVEEIPKSLQLFDQVYSIKGGRNWKKQLLLTYLLLPKLLSRRYDAVIDLQNNIISKTVRKALMPKAWSEFDRYASVPAGECTRLAIEAIGFSKCRLDSNFKIKRNEVEITKLLYDNGWNGNSNLVLLNPAGAFETRNWPMSNYVFFAELWLDSFPNTQFIMIGTEFISDKANHLKQRLGTQLINLVTKTNLAQAFALIQKIQLVLSEDSGLMHMAWVSGVPTLALFGSTRSDRATPLGKHSSLLESSDLSCGNCMLEECRYGDNHCITRYTPQSVFEKAVSLLKRIQPAGFAVTEYK